MAPDASMVMWMQNELMPYRKAMAPNLLLSIAGEIPGALVLPGGMLVMPSGEKEYFQLEISPGSKPLVG
jgi:hypothetical protein